MNNQDLQAECNQKILNALKHIALTVCPFLSQKQQRQLSPKGKNDFKEKQFPDEIAQTERFHDILNTRKTHFQTCNPEHLRTSQTEKNDSKGLLRFEEYSASKIYMFIDG